MIRPPAPEPGDVNAPAYGYQVPPAAYGLGADPLVTPPTEGFGGWFRRLFATLGRSWKSLVLISLCTTAVPIAALSTAFAAASQRLVVPTPAGSTAAPSIDMGRFGTVMLIALAAIPITSYLTAVANAATVWSLTREAAGQPAPLRTALGFGLRKGVRLWGWSLLYSLMILAGLCACILPGLYFALAGCLYVPIALYIRGGNPIGMSFSAVNRSFAPALGRMALLVLMVYGVELVLSIPVQFVQAASAGAGLAASVVEQLVTAPLALVLTVGSVLLFAELWARQVPTTTTNLDHALATT
jgi:hypothetical protein